MTVICVSNYQRSDRLDASWYGTAGCCKARLVVVVHRNLKRKAAAYTAVLLSRMQRMLLQWPSLQNLFCLFRPSHSFLMRHCKMAGRIPWRRFFPLVSLVLVMSCNGFQLPTLSIARQICCPCAFGYNVLLASNRNPCRLSLGGVGADLLSDLLLLQHSVRLSSWHFRTPQTITS